MGSMMKEARMSAERSRPSRKGNADSPPKRKSKSAASRSSTRREPTDPDSGPICCNLGEIQDAAVRLMGLGSQGRREAMEREAMKRSAQSSGPTPPSRPSSTEQAGQSGSQRVTKDDCSPTLSTPRTTGASDANNAPKPQNLETRPAVADDYDDIEPGWLCPFCGESANHGGCEHLIAVGDCTYPHALGIGSFYDLQEYRCKGHSERLVDLENALTHLIKAIPRPPRNSRPKRLQILIEQVWPVAPKGAKSLGAEPTLDSYAGLRAFRGYIETLWSSHVPGIVRQHVQQDNLCPSVYAIYFAHVTDAQMRAVSAAIERDVKAVQALILRHDAAKERAKAHTKPRR
jgi:hypothetical protein